MRAIIMPPAPRPPVTAARMEAQRLSSASGNHSAPAARPSPALGPNLACRCTGRWKLATPSFEGSSHPPAGAGRTRTGSAPAGGRAGTGTTASTGIATAWITPSCSRGSSLGSAPGPAAACPMIASGMLCLRAMSPPVCPRPFITGDSRRGAQVAAADLLRRADHDHPGAPSRIGLNRWFNKSSYKQDD